MSDKPDINPKQLGRRHPIILNLLIIIAVAIIGLLIVYLSIAIFTKHGESDKVPGVENMTYTHAIEVLHDHGFKVDIRDSLYKDDVKPGYVIEQFPKAGSTVKPGRKIFLYINAVHPKEVVIDDDNHPTEDALKSFSPRSGLARLQELGFKNVRVVKVLGDNDCIVKVLANGVPVKKMQKVPVNAAIVVQVYDGRLAEIRDSLQNEELIATSEERRLNGETFDFGYGGTAHYPSESETSSQEGNSAGSGSSTSSGQEEEEIEYY
ncbi:MAG: PASTA domain-containing protein [Muribaculaceae bacterium]|nr:PASTA domain-containing protein [Muribaculaceae bacterium]